MLSVNRYLLELHNTISVQEYDARVLHYAIVLSDINHPVLPPGRPLIGIIYIVP